MFQFSHLAAPHWLRQPMHNQSVKTELSWNFLHVYVFNAQEVLVNGKGSELLGPRQLEILNP